VGPSITVGELAQLVGTPVDGDRGAGYLPPQRRPEPVIRYAAGLALLLPRPDLDDDPLACMRTGLSWPHRLAAQLLPRRGGRDCCWYHGGDWQAVNATAIRLTARATREVIDEAARDGVRGWQFQALESLFLEPIDASHRAGYIGGRHRAKAILDSARADCSWPNGSIHRRQKPPERAH